MSAANMILLAVGAWVLVSLAAVLAVAKVRAALREAVKAPAPDAMAFAVAAHLREVNPVRLNPYSEHAFAFMRWRARRWRVWARFAGFGAPGVDL